MALALATPTWAASGARPPFAPSGDPMNFGGRPVHVIDRGSGAGLKVDPRITRILRGLTDAEAVVLDLALSTYESQPEGIRRGVRLDAAELARLTGMTTATAAASKASLTTKGLLRTATGAMGLNDGLRPSLPSA